MPEAVAGLQQKQLPRTATSCPPQSRALNDCTFRPNQTHLRGAFKACLAALCAALLAQHAGRRHSCIQLGRIKIECVGQAAAQPVDVVVLPACMQWGGRSDLRL